MHVHFARPGPAGQYGHARPFCPEKARPDNVARPDKLDMHVHFASNRPNNVDRLLNFESRWRCLDILDIHVHLFWAGLAEQ